MRKQNKANRPTMRPQRVRLCASVSAVVVVAVVVAALVVVASVVVFVEKR